MRRVGLDAFFVVFAKHDIEQVPRGDDAGALPGWRKVLEIARYQIICPGGLCTFKEDIVVHVGACTNCFGRPYP